LTILARDRCTPGEDPEEVARLPILFAEDPQDVELVQSAHVSIVTSSIDAGATMGSGVVDMVDVWP